MIRRKAILVLSAVALATMTIRGASAGDDSPPVVVFSAASLKNVMDAAIEQWNGATGNRAVASYSHAAALARQIEQEAPADLFISADLEWMDYLDQRRLIDPSTRVNLLGNALVLIAAADNPVRLTLSPGVDLAGAVGDGRIAVCTIATCPGGKYAKAALTSLGIWDSTRPKLVDQETIRVALAIVARGEATMGIVYATDARIEPRVRVVDTFPADSHPPIVYPAAVTTQSTNPAARPFLAYLQSPAARALFERYGFSAPQ